MHQSRPQFKHTKVDHTSKIKKSKFKSKIRKSLPAMFTGVFRNKKGHARLHILSAACKCGADKQATDNIIRKCDTPNSVILDEDTKLNSSSLSLDV